MSREAMQQALEALENAEDFLIKPYSTEGQNAIKALRQALETEQEPRPCKVGSACVPTDNGSCACSQLTPSTNSVVTQTEQEPVAWIHNFIEGGISIGKKPTDLNRHPDRWTALYKDPTPCKTCQALAMAVMNDQTYHEKVTQKQWVGLTDEDEIPWDGVDAKSFARAIEAKLKEKNT